MRQDFSNLIKRLSTDELTAVKVIDSDKNVVILNATLGEDLKKEYGSVQNYFEHLHKTGTSNIVLQEYRKNGTSFKQIGLPFPASFSSKNENIATPVEKRDFAQFSSFGLNGTGLGFPEIMEMHSKSINAVEYKAENQSLKDKIETLKEENFRLREELMQKKYSVESKESNNQLIVGILQAVKPIGEALAQKGGLNSPAPAQPQFSQYKQEIFNLLQQNEFSEAFAQFILQIISSINTDQEKYTEILKIINNQPQEQTNDEK